MKQEKLFKNSSVWKIIMEMAVPALLGILVMILYNMADMYFISFTHNDAMVAGISVSSPVYLITMAFATMIGNGGCTLIAQKLGADNSDQVKKYSSASFIISLISGLLVMISVLFFQKEILRVLGVNEEIYPYAKDYIVYLSFGAPFLIFANAFGNIIRAEGATKKALLFNLSGTLTNIILDPLFIIVFNWGTKGAAVATVLGNVVSSLGLIMYIRSSQSTLSLLNNKFRLKNFLEIIVIGLPSAVSTLMSALSSTLANRLLVDYGTSAVAAMAASGKTTMIISMMVMGICLGVQPYLAYCYGAGDYERLKETMNKLTILSVLTGLVFSLGSYLLRYKIVSIFLTDTGSVELAVNIVRIIVFAGPFYGLFYLGTSYLQSCGKAPLASIITLLRQGIIFIPLLYLLNYKFGIFGNASAHLGADIISAVISYSVMWICFNKLMPEKELVLE